MAASAVVLQPHAVLEGEHQAHAAFLSAGVLNCPFKHCVRITALFIIMGDDRRNLFTNQAHPR